MNSPPLGIAATRSRAGADRPWSVDQADGAPLAVHVYEGNTSDPVTVPEQVQTLRTRFGITELVFVGDRGMVKAKGKAALTTAGFRYYGAHHPAGAPAPPRTGPAPEWFTPHVHEVAHGTCGDPAA